MSKLPDSASLPVVDALSAAQSASVKSALFRFSESNGEKLTSDKVYGVFMTRDEGGLFGVKALYGGRKASSVSAADKIAGASEEKALAVFEKERQARLKKEYQPVESADALRAEAVTAPGADLPLTAAVAKKFPKDFNDGFARPDRAQGFGVLKREGEEHLFEMCGADLVFCDIFVGPKEDAEAFVKALSPKMSAWHKLADQEDEDESPVAALALWEGAPGEHSVAGIFVVAQDTPVYGDFLSEALALAPGMVEIANSGNDNSSWDAFGEIPGDQPWTGLARQAVARAVSAETAKWILEEDGAEREELRHELRALAAQKEARALAGAVGETGAKARAPAM